MIAIRPAKPDDLPTITAIYGHHVRTGLASFEEIAPDLAEMTRRYDDLVSRGFPYVAAEREGAVLGYAYAGPYRARSGYRYTVEDTVYVAPELGGRGIGRQLLNTVVEQTTAMGMRQMIAVIGDSANAGSIGVHRACGFRITGTMEAVGFKFGRWVDSVVMQRALGPGAAKLPG